MCPEHLLSWVMADAQESHRESLLMGSAQPPTISGLQSVLEADQYIDSGIEASVVKTHGDVTQSPACALRARLSLPPLPQ